MSAEIQRPAVTDRRYSYLPAIVIEFVADAQLLLASVGAVRSKFSRRTGDRRSLIRASESIIRVIRWFKSFGRSYAAFSRTGCKAAIDSAGRNHCSVVATGADPDPP
jgi:hypothetical protein